VNRTPLSQGGLDGLCGLYATVNAIGLLFPSAMTAEASDQVFKVIAKSLGGWPEHLFNGTTDTDIRDMLNAARAYLRRHFQLAFSWEQPFAHKTPLADFEEFARELGRRIKGDDAFAIVGISKPWEHWTCAHRLTEHEMIMTDSCHVKQIALAKCGLAGDGTDYEFDHKQTFTLMKAS
jgi:hypothetical protein